MLLSALYKLHGDFFEAMDKFANDRKLAVTRHLLQLVAHCVT